VDVSLVGYADIGGFGAGSDLTYQLLVGVNWQFAKSATAKAGYRYLYQDYEHDGFCLGHDRERLLSRCRIPVLRTSPFIVIE
jgi:opacity protein-like surface antigen